MWDSVGSNLCGNVPSKTWKKNLDVAYEDILSEFEKVWCVKHLIATLTNLVVS